MDSKRRGGVRGGRKMRKMGIQKKRERKKKKKKEK